MVHRLTNNVKSERLFSAGLISCFSVSAAGRYVVSGSAVGAIKLWSLKEGVQLDMQEAAHPAGLSALAFLEPAVVCCISSPWPRAESNVVACATATTAASCAMLSVNCPKLVLISYE